jgi:hypothetical protein
VSSYSTDAVSSVPDVFAAALDITSEFPRLREDHPAPEWNAGTRAGPPAPAQAAPMRATAYADETMELPIFRELESAWFRHSSTPPTGALSDPAATGAYASDASTSTGGGSMGMSATSTGGRMSASEPSWRTAADEGWLAATAAANPNTVGSTDAGLPRRTPMAQLVPGGVEKGAGSTNRRSPEQVRGLLSAYHRGVQRGRTRSDETDMPESDEDSGETSYDGKEQDE